MLGNTPGSRWLMLLAVLLISLSMGVSVTWSFSGSASAALQPATPASFGAPGPEAGQLSAPTAVAANDGTHDVYVADAGNARIEQFAQDGTFIRGWGWGVTDGKAELEVCEATCQAGIAGAGNGQLNSPVGIAVDNSAGLTKGDVYVADAANNKIEVFSAEGALLGVDIDGSGAPQGVFQGLNGLAVDGQGDVWTVDSTTKNVDEFDATGAYVAGSQFSDGYASTKAIAVNAAASRLYLMNGVGLDEGATEVWDPANPAAGATLIDNGGLAFANPAFAEYQGMSLAVDPVSGDLYVEDVGNSPSVSFFATVIRYDPSGKALEHFGGEGVIAAAPPFAEPPQPQGLAIDPTAELPGSAPGTLYAVENPSSDVRIFAPPPLIEPSVNSTSAANVTTTSADLNARVNPNFYDTHAHFEYTTTDFTSCGTPANPDCLTTPEVDIGSAGTDQTTTAHIQGLAPETSYRYRALAANGNGAPAVGHEKTITTQGQPAPGESCPNEALRIGPSAGLPDCRAYEKVSPADKGGGDIKGIDGISSGGVVQAGPDGGAVTYASLAAFATPQGHPLGSQYLSRRSGSGWSVQNITAPTRQEEYALAGEGSPYRAFSTDLGSGLELEGDLPLPPGLPARYENYYLRDDRDGAFQALLTTPPHGNGEALLSPQEFAAKFHFQSTSPDLRHIAFSASAVLAPGGTYRGLAEPNLYEWSGSDGQFHPINIFPGVSNGETAPEASFGGEPGIPAATGIVSEDGTRVFWTGYTNTLHGPHPALFVRENSEQSQSPLDAEGHCDAPADACTVQVDAAQSGASGESGHGEFRLATPDGSLAFFTDSQRLTPDSTAGGPENEPFQTRQDLYSFDTRTGHLTDLTVDHNSEDIRGASVQGVLGAGAEGASVYFVANGVLASGASSGDCIGHEGTCNLYLSAGDTTTYIATLSNEGDVNDWNTETGSRTARVSADGAHAVFMSTEPLTGYDSAGQSEVFEYDAPTASEAANHETGRLVCVSCNPSGARPSGASSIPAGTDFKSLEAVYQSRVLSADGNRVFFDSSDAISPADTNGREDVYEWEAEGEGSCVKPAGCVSLISSGTAAGDSGFVDADETGENVFFITGQQLVKADDDKLFDLYDAREKGGVPPGEPPAALCEGDACHSSAFAPGDPTLGTSVSSGSSAGTGTSPKPAVKKTKPLTRAQKLAMALKTCKRDRPKKARSSCEGRARKRYGPTQKTKQKAARKTAGKSTHARGSK